MVMSSWMRRSRARYESAKKRPELLATAANEIWSWDITKLHGPTRGLFYDLYVVIDIFSRYVPGWLVAAHEDAELAKEFLEDAVLTQGVPRGQFLVNIASRSIDPSHCYALSSTSSPIGSEPPMTPKIREMTSGRSSAAR